MSAMAEIFCGSGLAADDEAVADDLRRHRLDAGEGLQRRQERVRRSQDFPLADRALIDRLDRASIGRHQQYGVATGSLERHMGDVAHGAIDKKTA